MCNRWEVGGVFVLFIISLQCASRGVEDLIKGRGQQMMMMVVGCVGGGVRGKISRGKVRERRRHGERRREHKCSK